MRSVALSFAVLSAACQSNVPRLDLHENDQLYRGTGYAARVACDRDLFLTPITDQRPADAPVDAAGPFPVSWMPDAGWSRPMPSMLDDVLAEEIERSGVARGLEREPPPGESTLVVTPTLIEARCGTEERPAGRRSIGEIALRVVVHGPTEGGAARPVLFDRTFREIVATPVERRPADPTQILGVTLQKVAQKALAALDQSNVTRSGLPIDPKIAGTAPESKAPESKD